jgi:Sec-independent protein translocase protein TatA
MLRLILIFIAAWLLYKLIFELIVPVYKSTKIVRSKFREMQEQMQQHMSQQQPQDNFTSNNPTHSSKADDKDGDYIEFEEVK